MKLNEIKPNPDNPRILRDGKFAKLKQSLQDFPEMMDLRPIVVDENGIILGGNMRFRALQELYGKNGEIPGTWVKRADELTEEQKKEFIIKDNVSFGDWNFDALKGWDEPLDDWGVDVPIAEAPKKMQTQEVKPFELSHILISYPVKKHSFVISEIEKILLDSEIQILKSAN